MRVDQGGGREDSKSYNKNQDCKDLMDKNKGGGCRFQAKVKRRLSSHQSLRGYLGHNEAWDLEDLGEPERLQLQIQY